MASFLALVPYVPILALVGYLSISVVVGDLSWPGQHVLQFSTPAPLSELEGAKQAASITLSVFGLLVLLLSGLEAESSERTLLGHRTTVNPAASETILASDGHAGVTTQAPSPEARGWVERVSSGVVQGVIEEATTMFLLPFRVLAQARWGDTAGALERHGLLSLIWMGVPDIGSPQAAPAAFGRGLIRLLPLLLGLGPSLVALLRLLGIKVRA